MTSGPAHLAVPVGARSAAGRQLFVLAGLCGFAISQPVLSVLGDDPATLVHYGIEGSALIVVAAAIAFVPPLLLWALIRLISLTSTRAGRAAYLLTLGVLAALFVVQLVKQLGLDLPLILLLLALVAGGGFLVAYARMPAVSTWAAYTAILPVLAVASFLFLAPSSALLHARGAAPERVADAGELPSVVFVILDELPTRSLLDDADGIDPIRFPNLSALSDDATWYRRDTALAAYTSVAVPSMLTGQVPVVQDALSSNYPDNLFTLLAPTHELEVLETATRLCPFSDCEPTEGRSQDATGPTHDIRETLEVAADVWRERVSLGPSKPAALDDFSEDLVLGDLSSGSGPSEEPASTTTSTPTAEPGLADPDDRFERPEDGLLLTSARAKRFTDSFDAGKGPALYYLHLMLPHQPWLRAPDGAPYEVDDPLGTDLPDEDRPLYFSWSPWTAAVTEQRHLLQAQYADRMLGEIIEGLRASGLYDSSLIVVTSDHGISFEERTEARRVAPSSVDALAYTPLLIKAPGQHDAVVDDSNMTAIDVVPTIADHLGIPLTWAADGAPAGSPAIAARGDDKVMYDLEGVYELELGDAIPFSDRATFPMVGERWIGALHEGDHDLAGLDRRLGLDGVLGRSLDSLDPATGGQVEISSIDRLRRPTPGKAPLGVVAGQVRDAPVGARLVLSVNGQVVAGSELSEDSSGRGGLFLVLLPEGVLQEENEIRVALVTDDEIVELEVTG